MCREAMRFFAKQGGRAFFAILNYHYARIERALGNMQSARQHGQTALNLAQQIGLEVEIPIMQSLVNQLRSNNQELRSEHSQMRTG